MEEKIRVYQSKICRICLNSGEMVNIFTRNLQQMYENVTNLPISKNDQMPKVICSNCLPKIQEAYFLIMQAKRSYGNFCEANENEDDVSTTTTTIAIVSLSKQQEEEKKESITAGAMKRENQYETVDIQIVEDTDSIDSDKAATVEYEDLDSQLQEIVGNEEHDDDNVDEDDDDDHLLVIRTNEDKDGNLLIISTKEERLGSSKSEQSTNCGNDDDIDAVSFLIERQLEEENLYSNQENAGRKKSKLEDRKHECQVCHKKFLRKSNLVDHLRLHANVKLFKCEFCDKAFVQSGNYRSHIRIHTNERPYVCHICPKSYNQSSALKIHIRSHTNEKNYKCDICSKAFTNSSDLGKHKRVHDPEKKIKCEFCNKSFAQKANLKLHMKNNHRDKLVQVES